jgi:hypothetical protein
VPVVASVERALHHDVSVLAVARYGGTLLELDPHAIAIEIQLLVLAVDVETVTLKLKVNVADDPHSLAIEYFGAC